MVTVGVRAGSAVTMWSNRISAWSATKFATFSDRLEYGFTAVTLTSPRSNARVTPAVCAGLPVM